MMKAISEIPVSVLDLATVLAGDSSPAPAFKRSVAFAQQAERSGYTRYWFAEHHNMESVASSATAVLIGHVAHETKSIRVGSGGIMLPNHAPLIIAEQFGTLESLYPGRIDLGIGRAPGTDQVTSAALRRTLNGTIDAFPDDVIELINYLGPSNGSAKVKAVPGMNTNVPVWLLGSSTYSAQLAALLGLPFAFASHFAPAQLMEALKLYKLNFKPSAFLSEPYAMACVNVIAADTDDEADFLATSFYQMALGMLRNMRKPMPPPVDSMEAYWSNVERSAVFQMLYYTYTGATKTLQNSLQAFADQTGVDEIMVATHVYDEAAKIKSLELIASLFKAVS